VASVANVPSFDVPPTLWMNAIFLASTSSRWAVPAGVLLVLAAAALAATAAAMTPSIARNRKRRSSVRKAPPWVLRKRPP
jgi:hypothetical protein